MTGKLDFHPKFLTCIRSYSKSAFLSDLMAGVIVGIVALPLAIAFAIASGVSPEKGIITGQGENPVFRITKKYVPLNR